MNGDPWPPFWLVWREDGDNPTYRHPTQDSAESEALRLARLHPGSSFCVLMPFARFTENRVTIERFNTLDIDVPF